MRFSTHRRVSTGRDAAPSVWTALTVLAALLVGVFGVSGSTTGIRSLWAQSGSQSGPAHPYDPYEPKVRALRYVPAQKGKEARILFVPPVRNFKREQNFRLQTPRGVALVHCKIPRHLPSPKPSIASGGAGSGANNEIQPVLEENLYYFRSPSVPIYLSPPYEGYTGGALYEARLNGTTVRSGNHNDSTGNNSTALHEDVSPIVLRGKRNKLSLIMVNTDNE